MYRVGIIGLGDFGSFAANVFKYLKQFELTAISEIDKSVAIPDAVKFYKNYQDMLNDPEIDIVYIATENFSHAKIAAEALEKNKKVLSEKPLFIDQKSNRQIKKAFSISPNLIVNFVLPNSVLYQKIFKTISSKRLGNLLYIRAENYATESFSKPWYHDESKSGGWFATSDIHFIHLIYIATGRLPELSNSVKYENKKVISTVCYLNGGGIPFVIYHHMKAKNFEQCHVRFVFEKGTMTVYGWVPLKLIEKSHHGVKISREAASEEEVYLKLIAENYQALISGSLSKQFEAAVKANELALEINKLSTYGKN